LKSLTGPCRFDFTAKARSLGDKLFLSEAIQLSETDGTRFLAYVTEPSEQKSNGRSRSRGDSDTYRVVISLDNLDSDGFVDANCECTHARRENLCGHVWGTLLELEAMLRSEQIELPDHGPFDTYVETDLALTRPTARIDWSGGARKLPADSNSGRARDPRRRQTLDKLSRSGGRSLSCCIQGKESQADSWELKLRWMSDVVSQYGSQLASHGESSRPIDSEVWYVLDVSSSLDEGQLVIYFYQRTRRQDGRWGKIKRLKVSEDKIDEFPRASDRELLRFFLDDEDDHAAAYMSSYYRLRQEVECGIVSSSHYEWVLRKVCRTERFLWTLDSDLPIDEAMPLALDEGEAWRMQLQIVEDADDDHYRLMGRFIRGEEVLPVENIVMVLAPHWIISTQHVCRLSDPTHFGWITVFRQEESVRIPRDQIHKFVRELSQVSHLPELLLPEELKVERVMVPPRARLVVDDNDRRSMLVGSVHFEYEDEVVWSGDSRGALLDSEKNRLIVRDLRAEQTWKSQLFELGFVRSADPHQPKQDIQFPHRELTRLVHHLVNFGWHVEAKGKLFRSPGSFNIQVVSDVNWFELEGAIDFDGMDVPLPKLLAAIRAKETYIRLDDGTHGMIPEQWLERYAFMAGLGEAEGGKLRFSHSQALLLDALLAEHQPEVDQAFDDFRQRLREFQGIQPVDPPEGFLGTLRPYQRDGLGWLRFLDEMNLGGCLADDMGLGKTIQVLAHLEARRQEREQQEESENSRKSEPSGRQPFPPSLVVVPKSLVFNWIDEAARFTPKLRVLNHTGVERANLVGELGNYDLIITTYGTLRRDIVELKEVEFEYAILDEAQAIKNAQSQAAKATRLLKARRRLAMTGTPVENHLGELWSLFEFLNPGILGRATSFQRVARRGSQDSDDVARLAQGLRPFILRRTKKQVLHDLPEKSEQTLFCELSPEERSQYDELREYYRRELVGQVKSKGLAKSKIHVLEALLRLRQAACHPGLLNPKQTGKLSTKIETLLEQLEELVDEGHKALVFSQFTSLLGIVRPQLEKRKIAYQYLDGQTRDRRSCVEQFQQGDEFPVFLISLKAGGHGLNLTAADYVFILDPWWNPAVEAQAVDRAHRIGQERPVFAYRLICRDTVEEKILELQKQKRELADAIVSENNSLLQDLSMADLELLLS
jgi:superfamily II DNA or RNA helicase